METKVCNKCNQEKPLSRFAGRMLAKGYTYRLACKDCDYERRRANPTPNRTEKSRLAAERRKKGIPAPSRKTTYEQKRIVARNSEFRRFYGITHDQFLAMAEEQNWQCKICEVNPSEVYESSNKRTLCVDHCHATGRVRGLLCSKCNTGLGMFEDNIEFLESAIAYLH